MARKRVNTTVDEHQQHPTSFLVLGVFWPPAKEYQPRLDLDGER